jgi:hypothetical protein
MIDTNSFCLDVPESTRDYVPTMHIVEGRKDRLGRYELYDKLNNSGEYHAALSLIAREKEGAVLKQLIKWQMPTSPRDVGAFDITRKVLLYGDWFMFKSPVEEEFMHINPRYVLGALVDNEKERGTIEAWVIKDFTFDIPKGDNVELQGSKAIQAMSKNTTVVPHSYIRHISMMTTGPVQRIDSRSLWPFGISWLDEVIKEEPAAA